MFCKRPRLSISKAVPDAVRKEMLSLTDLIDSTIGKSGASVIGSSFPVRLRMKYTPGFGLPKPNMQSDPMLSMDHAFEGQSTL